MPWILATRADSPSLRTRLLPVAFFSMAGLSIFFSKALLHELLGLKMLILMSSHLDKVTLIISSNAFAWICLAARKIRRLMILGTLLLAGSVLQALPMMARDPTMLQTIDVTGAILVACSAVASTVVGIRKSGDLFQISCGEATRKFLLFLCSLVIPLQIWSIVTLANLARPIRVYPNYSVYAGFEDLLKLVFPVTVVLFTLLVTEWLWFAPVTRTVQRATHHGYTHLASALCSDKKEGSPLVWRVLLGVSLLLGVFVSAYQWSRGYPLGQDARYYSYVLRHMESMGFQTVFSTERPVLFLAMYFLARLLGVQYQMLLQLMPIVLSVVLVIVTYLFTRLVAQSERVAALAAMLAAVSPHITVGVEIYIVANWLGIPLMMLLLYGFIRSVQTRLVRWALPTIVLSALILGAHYFTWIFTLAVLVMYLIMSVATKHTSHFQNRFCALLVLGCFSVAVPALVFASFVGGGAVISFQRIVQMTSSLLTKAGPNNIFGFLLSQSQSYEYFAREHYAIPMFYTLALVGSLGISLKHEEGRLIRSWLIASCLGTLLIPSDQIWRFLYMMPLEILSAYGLSKALQFLNIDSDGLVGKRTILIRLGLPLILFVAFGITLTFTTLPSWILFLCLGAVALIELAYPSGEAGLEASLLVAAFIMLEQTARALYTLA